MQIQPFPKFNTCKTYWVTSIIGAALVVLMMPMTVSADIEIVPHRAGYALEIRRTSQNSRISDAEGAMLYTWGETCDGWLIEQKFVLNVVRVDGVAMDLTAISSTWEAKDGSRFRFSIKRKRNGEAVEKIRGEGRIDGVDGSGFAEFELPKKIRIKLPKDTVFPTKHTLRLIQLAKEGVRTDRQFVFDGSKLESASPVSAFILQPKTSKNPSPALNPPFGPFEVRNIHLAFFAATGVAPEPEFEMSIELQDNGIAPSLILNYGDYSVKGVLTRLEPLEKPDC